MAKKKKKGGSQYIRRKKPSTDASGKDASPRVVRKRSIDPPSERQLKAFEHYFVSGDNRAYSKTAKVIGVSTVSVSKWAKRYNWEKELETRSMQLKQQMAKETDRIFRTERQKHLAIIKTAIDEALLFGEDGKLIGTKFKVRNTQDYERMFKLMCYIYGIRLPDEGEAQSADLSGLDPKLMEELVQELRVIIRKKYYTPYSPKEELSDEEQQKIIKGEL